MAVAGDKLTGDYSREVDVTGRRHDFGNWREEYRRKTVSTEEAARAVKSGDRVVMANR